MFSEVADLQEEISCEFEAVDEKPALSELKKFEGIPSSIITEFQVKIEPNEDAFATIKRGLERIFLFKHTNFELSFF